MPLKMTTKANNLKINEIFTHKYLHVTHKISRFVEVNGIAFLLWRNFPNHTNDSTNPACYPCFLHCCNFSALEKNPQNLQKRVELMQILWGMQPFEKAKKGILACVHSVDPSDHGPFHSFSPQGFCNRIIICRSTLVKKINDRLFASSSI